MRIATLLGATLCLASVASLAPSAQSQSLSGQWFKVTAKGSGFSVTGGINAEMVKFAKLTAYVQLFAKGVEGGGPSYSASMWQQDGNGDWVPSTLGSIGALDSDQTAMTGSLTFFVPGTFGEGSGVQGFDASFVASAKIKVKNEEIKSAKIAAIGALASGSYTGVDSFIGTAQVSMSRVAESKLPFEPVLKTSSTSGQPTPIVPAWRTEAPTTPAPQAPVAQPAQH